MAAVVAVVAMAVAWRQGRSSAAGVGRAEARADQANATAEEANRIAAGAREAADRSAAAAERSAAAHEETAEHWATWMSQQEKRDQRQWSGPPRGDIPGWQTRDGDRGPYMGMRPGLGPTGPVVHWTVDRVQGRQHQLKNLGRATAYEVALSSEHAVRFDAPPIQDIDMGGAVEFLAIGSLQTGTPELVVSWRDSPGGERHEWRRPLP